MTALYPLINAKGIYIFVDLTIKETKDLSLLLFFVHELALSL